MIEVTTTMKKASGLPPGGDVRSDDRASAHKMAG